MSGERPYGALYALYSRRNLGHVELELLELLAGHASVALTNAMAFEEALRQRAHERAVIDGSADGIAVLDADGLVRQWNPAAHRLTGCPPQMTPWASRRRSRSQSRAPSSPTGCPAAAGWMCSAPRWPSSDERVIDFRDVTAAKELEEAKDLFLATTSHELRTPITVVQGFASTLASALGSAHRRRPALGGADDRRTGRLLGRLVEQLLLGSRAGPTSCPVRNGPFDLAALLPGRCGRVPARCRTSTRWSPTSRATCRRPTATRWPPTSSSASCWRTHSSTHRRAARSPCRARARDGRIEVTVEDRGIGIADGDRERIFERFFQGEAGDRRRFGGIGIGLYIVRRLAVAQDGQVDAASRAGGGTVMRIVLRDAVAGQAAGDARAGY